MTMFLVALLLLTVGLKVVRDSDYNLTLCIYKGGGGCVTVVIVVMGKIENSKIVFRYITFLIYNFYFINIYTYVQYEMFKSFFPPYHILFRLSISQSTTLTTKK